MNLFLSPHNDDAALFGAFTVLRERPLVLTIFDSRVQAARGAGTTVIQRRSEDIAAMQILGASVMFLGISDATPDAELIKAELRKSFLQPEMVYAPAVEEGGHAGHNIVGEIAGELFRNVTYYMTYTRSGKSRGVPVPFERDWPLKKLRALACYESQIALPDNVEHFLREQREYYA